MRDTLSTVSGKNINLSIFFEKYATLFGYIVLFIVFVILSKTFILPTNLLNILRQISMLAIISVGLTYVLIVGEFDLSIGLVSGLLGVLCVGLLGAGFPISLAVFLIILLGLGIGALNGFLVVYVGIPAFIGTLAMGSIAFGINFAYTDGYPMFEGITKSFRRIAEGMLWFVPYPIIWMIIIVMIASFYLNRTKMGRYLYATGENKEAALFSGVNVNFCKMLAFIIAGLGVGITAIIMTARMGSGQPMAGGPFLLDAFASVFLGSTMIKGGKFHVWGTFLGALFIGTMNNGFTLLSVPYYFQDILKGVLLLAAVALFSYQTRKRK